MLEQNGLRTESVPGRCRRRARLSDLFWRAGGPTAGASSAVHLLLGLFTVRLVNICSQVPSCEHAFCRSCIQEWISRQPTCPVDRQHITAAQLRQVPRILKNLLSRYVLFLFFVLLPTKTKTNNFTVTDYVNN